MSSLTLDKAYHESTQYTALLSPMIRVMMPHQIRKTTKKKPPFGVRKFMWKRIPQLMQRHQTLRVGYSRKNMATVQFLKLKHKVVTSATEQT